MRASQFLCLTALMMSSIGSAACRTGPALPASSDSTSSPEVVEHRAETSPVHDEDPIEAAVALTEELAATLTMHGKDCEKTADALEEFAARHAERVKTLKGVVSSNPDERNSDQRERIDEAMKVVGQVASECRSNPKFAAVFGTLAATQTEKPRLKQ